MHHRTWLVVILCSSWIVACGSGGDSPLSGAAGRGGGAAGAGGAGEGIAGMGAAAMGGAGMGTGGAGTAGSGMAGAGGGADRTATLVLTLPDGSAAQGVQVVFGRPDGSLERVVLTGADGAASAPVEPDSMVSFAGPVSERTRYLRTIAGVMPGDRLHRGIDALTMETPISQQLTWPGPWQGAAYYSLDVLGCASGFEEDLGALASIELRPSCLGPDRRAHVVAEALDMNGAPIANLVQLDAATDAPIALPVWSTTFDSVMLSVSNVPPGGQLSAFGGLLKDGEYYFGNASLQSSAPGSDSAALRFPAGIGAESSELYVSADAAPHRRLFAFRRQAGLPASVSLALDPALPFATPEPIRAEAGRPSFSWTVTGDRARVDLASMFVVSSRRDATVPFAAWSVWMSPDATSIRFPELPDEMAALRISVDQVESASVEHTDVRGLDRGWDQLRTRVIAYQDGDGEVWSSSSFPIVGAPMPRTSTPTELKLRRALRQ